MRGVNVHGYACAGSKCERGQALDHPPPFASIEFTCIVIRRSTSTYMDKNLGISRAKQLCIASLNHARASVAGGA